MSIEGARSIEAGEQVGLPEQTQLRQAKPCNHSDDNLNSLCCGSEREVSRLPAATGENSPLGRSYWLYVVSPPKVPSSSRKAPRVET